MIELNCHYHVLSMRFVYNLRYLTHRIGVCNRTLSGKREHPNVSTQCKQFGQTVSAANIIVCPNLPLRVEKKRYGDVAENNVQVHL